VELLDQGRISSGKAAELLGTVVHRVYELAIERGVEIGAGVTGARVRPVEHARDALAVRHHVERVVVEVNQRVLTRGRPPESSRERLLTSTLYGFGLVKARELYNEARSPRQGAASASSV
jgi:hypothetical protein